MTEIDILNFDPSEIKTCNKENTVNQCENDLYELKDWVLEFIEYTSKRFPNMKSKSEKICSALALLDIEVERMVDKMKHIDEIHNILMNMLMTEYGATNIRYTY